MSLTLIFANPIRFKPSIQSPSRQDGSGAVDRKRPNVQGPNIT